MTEQTAFTPKPVTILTGEPTVAVLAEMALDHAGVLQMADWVKDRRPDCTPEGGYSTPTDLLPHDGIEDPEGIDPVAASYLAKTRNITDNELLVELAGRKCYDSFAEKAGKKSNREYIANTQSGNVPHASIMYHAKMTFFVGGISRRVSHELIRNYVGADRTEEGSPSQESTRFTHHTGRYIAPPRDLAFQVEMRQFTADMQANYDSYCNYINVQVGLWTDRYGKPPTGMDRKRIYEAASQRLSHACETSFIWTANPVSLMKMFKERCDPVADLEFQRLALKWQNICVNRWPNLFQRTFP